MPRTCTWLLSRGTICGPLHTFSMNGTQCNFLICHMSQIHLDHSIFFIPSGIYITNWSPLHERIWYLPVSRLKLMAAKQRHSGKPEGHLEKWVSCFYLFCNWLNNSNSRWYSAKNRFKKYVYPSKWPHVEFHKKWMTVKIIILAVKNA